MHTTSAARTYLEVHCCESMALKHTPDIVQYNYNTTTVAHILDTIQQHTTPDTKQYYSTSDNIQIAIAIPTVTTRIKT